MIVLTTIARGESSRITGRRRSVAHTNEEWRALWALHAGPEADAPVVDFAAVTVAAAFAGARPSAGYSVEIAVAADDSGGVVLAADERAPGAGMASAQILTSPFHIVSLPRAAAVVRWAPADEPNHLSGTLGTGGIEIVATETHHRGEFNSGASSTGLDPRTASALAYLAGPFSGVLILLAESTNQTVRFHAWQSIVGLGGLGLAILISYLLAGVALFVSATGMSVMISVATVIWIVLAIVWALCLWKAMRGERWKLPLAGDFADRLAGG